jgi:hypothetical protein
MPEPSQKQALPPSPVRIALIILFIVAAAITVIAFILSKLQTPDAPAQSTIDTNLTATCQNACRACVSKEYDARCFDRCRFGFKPYCD